MQRCTEDDGSRLFLLCRRENAAIAAVAVARLFLAVRKF